MTENPYAIPVEDLVDSARVPLPAQITQQPERRFVGDDPDSGLPWGDGLAAPDYGE